MRIEPYRVLPAADALESELEALRRVENGGAETLLTWEADHVCAVLPRAGRGASWLRDSMRPGAPVLRRESGGGAVVLGPGCLNYAFALSLARRPDLLDVERSYQVLLGAVSDALPTTRAIGSDLVTGDCKVGGHAQRRTRVALLHHGTILYDFDLSAIGGLLREPARRPAYRGGRAHDAFVTNITVPRKSLLRALESAASALARKPLLWTA